MSSTTNRIELARQRRREIVDVLLAFTPDLDKHIDQAGGVLRTAIAAKKHVFALGNGGSASDAEHFVAELVGRFLIERDPIAATAFTTNSSALTAIGNDYGYDKVFERSVRAWAKPGDVVVCLSTSGNSPNVLAAAIAAKERDARVIGLTGQKGGKLAGLSDVALCVPSDHTPRIQEAHIFILHLLAEIVDLP